MVSDSDSDKNKDYLLGLDLGTSNCKALAMDVHGRIVASAAAPTPDLGPNTIPNASPQYDAEALWQLFAKLIRALDQDAQVISRIIGVCVSSMGESGVLIDANGAPCAPVITWHDQRTKPTLAHWQSKISPIDLYRETGLSLDHIYSASKLHWHHEHDPNQTAYANQWLGLADWITFKLTEVRGMSLPMASRTMLFNPATGQWSDKMAALTGLPLTLMPPLFASGEVVGHVSASAAKLTGLRQGIPVAAGGHDHICGSIAVNAVQPGVILDSAGTAEAFMATLDHSIAADIDELPGLGCGCHAVRGRYYLLGGILGGGSINWISELLCGNASTEHIIALMQAAATTPVGANGVRFLPYLRGSGPPKRDPNAFGAWVGFRLSHTRADLVRAAIEGLSFGFRKVVTLMQTLGNFRATELRASGGSTRNTFWQQVKADVIGLPIEVADEPEASAKGAALLAGVGAGVYANAVEAAAATYHPIARYEPNPANHAAYNTIYEKWLKLQPGLETLMED